MIVKQAVCRLMYNTAMHPTKIRRLSGILLLVFSLVLLIWGLIPEQTLVRTVEIAPDEMVLFEASAGIPPESRILRLSWPKMLRAGDPGTLEMSLDLAAEQSEGGLVMESAAGEVEAGGSGVYATQRVALQARLDLPGVAFSPTGEVSQVLLPDRKTKFIWNLRAREAGNYPGKAWLHLELFPLASGSTSWVVLTAQQFEIEVVEFMSLNGTQARVVGSLGVVIGALVGFDGITNWLIDWILKHRREE